jgi:hyaluronoglucosaminidase
MPVDVTKFGILGANWTQANIPTLQGSTNWQPSFRSLMPVVALNGSGLLLNGGVPQNANLTAFVEQLRSQVPLWIPAVQYTGLAVLDFEAWSTVWELNVEPGLAWHSQVYQNVSKQLVRARHPNWSEVQVEARAKEEFETAATAWFVTTLEVCKQIRPHAKWGWYGLPQGSSPIDYGQRQMPVFLAADAIYPSIYDFGDCSGTASEIKAQETYVRSLVAQSVSLSKAVFRAQPGRARAPPVYPFASEVCRASGPPILPREDLRASLVAPYAAGASGIVIWGMPAGDMAAAHINYTEYWAHVKAVTGPMAQAVSTDAERCAVESCSGNGRCLSLPNVRISSCSSHQFVFFTFV